MNTNLKFTLSLISILGCSLLSYGQKYMTQNATIEFFSETPIENIESINQQVSSVIDTESGQMVFSLLMKAFVFEKALMQEHFNEKYVESEKFPKATFKGEIIDFDPSSLGEEKTEVEVKGKLTIHGVTNEITAPGTLQMVDGKLLAKSTFNVKVADYDIKIPSTVEENIAKTIEIKIDGEYDKIE